jgi:hypothetical protein
MRTRGAGSFALTGLAVVDVAAVVVAQLLYPPGELDLLAGIIFTAAVATFSAVGAFLAIRVPGNRIGGLFLLAGTLLAAGVFSGAYAEASVTASGGTWPATPLLAWAADVLYIPPVIIVAAAVPSVFPDGNLPSSRWRWLPLLMIVGVVLASLNPGLSPGPVNETLTVENPFGVPALAPYLPIADTIATLVAGPVLLGAVAAVWTRYRRGSVVERQQIKWLLAVASLAAVAFTTAFLATAFVPSASIVSNAGWVAGFIALACLPVAIAIAIVRYRLFEIDRLVSRGLAWALVTGMLVVVFGGSILVLQGALGGITQGDTLAVAASTLVAAALFQPLRARVQRSVDRRFNRARVDAQRTLDDFGAHLRDDVDLVTLDRRLLGAVHSTVQPRGAAIWIRTGGR